MAKKAASKNSRSKKSILSSSAQLIQPRALLVIALMVVVGVTALYFTQASSLAVVREQFTDESKNFSTVVGGDWEVAGGTYSLTSPTATADPKLGNGNYAIHSFSLSDDFSLEVDLKVEDTSSAFNDASVIFGWQDPANYMYAATNESIDANTNGIFIIKNGLQTRLAAFPEPFSPGVARHVKVQRTGTSISAYVGSTKMGTATSSDFRSGRFGIGSRNDSVMYDNFTVSVTGDTVAPGLPQVLTSKGSTQTTATVSWNAPIDNIGVAGYHVYRSGTKVASPAAPTFTLSNLSPGTKYNVSVAAFDAAGNVSAQSSVLAVTTPANPTPTNATPLPAPVSSKPNTTGKNCPQNTAACGFPSLTTVGVPSGTQLKRISWIDHYTRWYGFGCCRHFWERYHQG